jgi:hypothetical protein
VVSKETVSLFILGGGILSRYWKFVEKAVARRTGRTRGQATPGNADERSPFLTTRLVE